MAPLTGRKVLAMTVGAFAVIVGVNLLLAFQAVRTFPGLEVANSYVASQVFDAERAAQEALGWSVSARTRDGAIWLSMTDAAGRPAEPAAVTALLGRPTTVAQDRTLVFARRGDAFVADAVLEPGLWHLDLAAEAQDGTAFRRRLTLRVAR